MNKIKKVIGFAILLSIIPIALGLLTIDGKLCNHGNCADVVPFWGGVFVAIQLYFFVGLILFVAWACLKLIYQE